jgi:hypothetical protein
VDECEVDDGVAFRGAFLEDFQVLDGAMQGFDALDLKLLDSLVAASETEDCVSCGEGLRLNRQSQLSL